MDVSQLQKKMEYTFQDREKLFTALTHSSYANEKKWGYERNNERLEFLGDAVLELISSKIIFKNHPKMPEGEMTKLRASLVCEKSLAWSARELDLGDYLRLGHGEIVTGGARRDSILSDAFEAIIGAMYLDSGYEEAEKFVNKFVLSDIEKKQLFYDSKTVLQEMVQAHGMNPISYHVIRESGPDHDKTYESKCCIGDDAVSEGIGKTKKASEQAAAYEAILKLREQDG